MGGVEIQMIGSGVGYRSERGGVEARGECTLNRWQYITARPLGGARERSRKPGGARPCARIVAIGGAFVS